MSEPQKYIDNFQCCVDYTLDVFIKEILLKNISSTVRKNQLN